MAFCNEMFVFIFLLSVTTLPSSEDFYRCGAIRFQHVTAAVQEPEGNLNFAHLGDIIFSPSNQPHLFSEIH